MNGGGTATVRSILDKPLKLLTEDDISQVTREDCRRFLKEKGMRRPSWNKSQAIQQVISLKALLEPPDDDFPATPPVVSSAAHHHHIPQGHLSEAPPVKAPAVKEPSFRAADEIPKSGSSGEKPTENNDTNVVSPRACATSESVGQMTIFYGGKVNVYDGVSPDKAREIMQLAASPVQFPQDDPLNRNSAVWVSPRHLPKDKDVHVPIDAAIFQVAQADQMMEFPLQYREKGSMARDAEGQAHRKVRVQRYIDKKKDRGRLKGKKLTGITSSNLEMFLTPPVNVHVPNGNSSRSSTSSPPQPRLPLATGGSADNQQKVALHIDLNDKDVQGC